MSTREGDREECAAKHGGVHKGTELPRIPTAEAKGLGIPGTFSSCDEIPDSSNLREDRFILFPGPEV